MSITPLLKTPRSTNRAKELFTSYIELMRTQEFEQSADTPEHKEYIYALDRLLDASVHVDDAVLVDALDLLPAPFLHLKGPEDVRGVTVGCDSVRKWMESIRLNPSIFTPRIEEGT